MASFAYWLKMFGIDPKRCFTAAPLAVRYWQDRRAFKAARGGMRWGDELPIIDERSASSGDLGAYFHQDLTIARWIYEAKPDRHVDVGSRIDGFIGHLAVFRTVEVIDIRPQPERVPNVKFVTLDLMAPLPAEWHAATDSLSCLHTLEHFGLGRYGDTINPQGHVEGMRQLQALVAPGGVFYFSTPIGPERVEFNAHRIFAVRTVLDWFGPQWSIERMAYLDDAGTMHELADWPDEIVANHFGCTAGLIMLCARKKYSA